MKPLSPKIIKPKNKYFISHVDEDSLKRFINNHLSKKYSSQKKKDLFSSRSEKYNRTIYKSSINNLSLKIPSNDLKIKKHDYNTINNDDITINGYERRVKSSSKNRIISIKYSVNNYKKRNIIKPILNESKRKKKDLNLTNCKSLKTFYKHNYFYNKIIPSYFFNKKNYNSNQNSKTDCSTFEKTEINSKRNNHYYIENYKFKSENNDYMSLNKFIQSLIDKFENLKFEINYLKKEKQKIEDELSNSKFSKKEKEYIDKLKNEIKYFQDISDYHKANCDQLTIQIMHLKAEIRKFQK